MSQAAENIANDNKQADSNPSPRFLKNYEKNPQSYDTAYNRFKLWVQKKIQYKSFRMEIIKAINQNKRSFKSKDKIDMAFLEELAPLVVINTVVVAGIVFRKEELSSLLLKTIAVGTYNYLVMMFYGEERCFYRASIKKDYVGYHIRKKFLIEFPDHTYSNYYRELNEKFESL